MIGWIGALAGIGLGILLALNAGDIVHVLERWFGFELFDPAVYYISPHSLGAARQGRRAGVGDRLCADAAGDHLSGATRGSDGTGRCAPL